MFSLRPKLSDPRQIRSTNVLFLSDSGSNIYNPNNSKSTKKSGQYLKNENKLRAAWDNLATTAGSGIEWKDWIPALQKVIDDLNNKNLLELCPDNIRRVPADYVVICVDNLNSIKPDTAANEDKWALNNESNERRTTLEKFQNDEFMPHLLDRLMDLLSQFKSAVYVRTARHDRWNLPSEVDRITDLIIESANAHKVIHVDGAWFWDSIKPFAMKKPNDWHHGQEPDYSSLHYHWDRFLFRLVCFSKACTLHPSILENLYDESKFDKLGKDIERNARLDGSASSGNPLSWEHGSADIPGSKAENIAGDIVPVSAGYAEQVAADEARQNNLAQEDVVPKVAKEEGNGSEPPSLSDDEGDVTNPPEPQDTSNLAPDPDDFVDDEEADDDDEPYEDTLERFIKFSDAVYNPTANRTFMRYPEGGSEIECIIPFWADDGHSVICSTCSRSTEHDDAKGERRITCQACDGILKYAIDESLPVSKTPWTREALKKAREISEICIKQHEESRLARASSDAPPEEFRKRLNEIYGGDHASLEGYNHFTASFKKALMDDYSSTKKRTRLKGTASPIPVPGDSAGNEPDETGAKITDAQKSEIDEAQQGSTRGRPSCNVDSYHQKVEQGSCCCLGRGQEKGVRLFCQNDLQCRPQM